MVWSESLRAPSQQGVVPAGPRVPNRLTREPPALGCLLRSPRSLPGQGCEPARWGNRRGDPGAILAREGPAWLRPRGRDVRRVVTRVHPVSPRPGWAGPGCARAGDAEGRGRVPAAGARRGLHPDLQDPGGPRPPTRDKSPAGPRGLAPLGPGSVRAGSLEFPEWPEGKWAGRRRRHGGREPRGWGGGAARQRPSPRPPGSGPAGPRPAPPAARRASRPRPAPRRPIGGRPPGASRVPIVMQI